MGCARHKGTRLLGVLLGSGLLRAAHVASTLALALQRFTTVTHSASSMRVRWPADHSPDRVCGFSKACLMPPPNDNESGCRVHHKSCKFLLCDAAVRACCNRDMAAGELPPCDEDLSFPIELPDDDVKVEACTLWGGARWCQTSDDSWIVCPDAFVQLLEQTGDDSADDADGDDVSTPVADIAEADAAGIVDAFQARVSGMPRLPSKASQ